MKNKRGVSPVIATVLLVSMVVIIAVIIFLWFRGMVGETVTKFGKNIELACEEVVFDASYSASTLTTGTLYVTNNGVVPIYDLNVKIEGAGSHETKKLSAIPTVPIWEPGELIQGDSFTGSLTIPSGTKNIILIPILLGSTDAGENKEFVCNEDYGVPINLEE